MTSFRLHVVRHRSVPRRNSSVGRSVGQSGARTWGTARKRSLVVTIKPKVPLLLPEGASKRLRLSFSFDRSLVACLLHACVLRTKRREVGRSIEQSSIKWEMRQPFSSGVSLPHRGGGVWCSVRVKDSVIFAEPKCKIPSSYGALCALCGKKGIWQSCFIFFCWLVLTLFRSLAHPSTFVLLLYHSTHTHTLHVFFFSTNEATKNHKTCL